MFLPEMPEYHPAMANTFCSFNISLSLRDKSHSPIEGLRIKLGAYGLKPWAESSSLSFGAKNIPNIQNRLS
jgi:hypothetical protein